ncbi:hypothetical protein FQA39_LY01931 [Lamprigera yunnana]|nr:hypothetical protein FQA39_LY01931 [Lamprigera yunnana]
MEVSLKWLVLSVPFCPLSSSLEIALTIASVWISPVLPQLLSEDSPIGVPLTKTEETWFVSAEKLAAVVGCVIVSWLPDTIGRKRMLLLAACPLIIEKFASAFAESAVLLISMRIAVGLSTGLVLVVLPLYVGEVSDKEIRGRLTTIVIIFSTFGQLYSYGVGPFVEYRLFTISCGIFPFIFIILFAFMPETPYILVKKGDIESAIRSVKFLSPKNTSSEAIQLRINHIQDFVTNEIQNNAKLHLLVVNKTFRKALLIAFGVKMISSFSGLYVLKSYLQTIIQTGGSTISPEISSVVFGATKLPSIVLAFFLVDRMGRKPLLIISCLGIVTILTAEGVYFYLRERVDMTNVAWVPTVGLCLYLVSNSFGVELMPAIVMGEYFTTHVKTTASACAHASGLFINFLLLRFFQPLSDALGVYVWFWFFAACCALGCGFAIFILPETKASSLQTALLIASAWMSPVLPQLLSEDSPIGVPLTKTEETWFVSTEKLAAVVGCVIVSWLTDTIGRKRLLLLAACPLIIEKFASAFAESAALLISMRIAVGLSTGLVVVVLPLYVGEVSDKEIRGRLTTIVIIFSTFGQLYSYGVGPFVEYRLFTISCGIFPFIFIILFAFMPETPYILVKNGDIESAIKSVKILSPKNTSSKTIQLQINHIQDFVTNEIQNNAKLHLLVVNKTFRKALLIAFGVKMISSFSGLYVLNSYLQTIIQTGGSTISPEISSVVFGATKLPSIVLAFFLVDRMGRKPLLIISCLGIVVSLAAEGVYFYLGERTDMTNVAWVPTVGLCLYLVANSFGVELMPAIVMGEYFTTHVKTTASACVHASGFFINFLLLRFFQPLSDALGVYVWFWFYAASCALGCLFAIFILPETKASSLQIVLSIASVWISPVLPQLLSEDSPIGVPLTKTEETWFVSAEKLAAVVGCVIVSWLTDTIGRKRMLLLAACPLIIEKFASAFAKSAALLISMRIAVGLSTGLVLVMLPLYVGEVSDKEIRGRLTTIVVIFSTLGQLYSYGVGPFVEYRLFTISCGIFPFIFIILFAFMPETPYILVKKGDIESAIRSVKFLSPKNTSSEAIQLRINHIQDFVTNEIQNNAKLHLLVVNKTFRKALLIAFGVKMISSFSGLYVLNSYLQTIIQTGGSTISPEISSVVFGATKLPSIVLAFFLVDRMGRKPLLIISCLGIVASLTAEGVYFYLGERTDMTNVAWVPTVGLCLYLVANSFGVELMPAIVMGEYFTTHVKTTASACAHASGFFINFLLLRFFQPLSDALGVYVWFWFYAASCALGCVFAIFILPETKASPGQYYADIGAKYGIKCDGEQLTQSFKTYFKELSKTHPNYGCTSGLGWENWWKQLITKTFRESNSTINSKVLEELSCELINVYTTSSCWKHCRGALDLLSYLRHCGIRLGVISNFDPRLDRTLRSTRIRHYFAFILSSYELGIEKPDPRIFAEAIKLSEIKNLQAEQCLHIGDSYELDYIGAKNAGWMPALINSNKLETEKSVNYSFSSLYDLHKFFMDKSGDTLITKSVKSK